MILIIQKYILVDLNEITPPYDGGPQKWDKLSFIKFFLKDLRLSILDTDYKIILTSTLYKNKSGSLTLSSGDHQIFISDLVLTIEKDIAKVIKNRGDFNDDYYSIYQKN